MITEQDDAEAFSSVASFKAQLLTVGIGISAALVVFAYAFYRDARARKSDMQAGWMFENMSEGAFILDKNGTFVQANGSLARILETSVDDVIGKDISYLGKNISLLAQRVSRSRTKTGNNNLTKSMQSIIKIGGSDKHLSLSFSPLDTTKESDVGCIILDVTADHEIKANLAKAKTVAEDTLAARTAFLQMVGHELRTPLNAVVGPLSIASVTDDPVERQDMITIAERCANDLTVTVSALEDFISLEAGETQPELEGTNLRDLLELASFEATNMVHKPSDVPITFESGVPETVNCDPRIVSWITKEIVANALLHASPREGENIQVQIHVGMERTPANEFLSIAITDNGQSFNSEDLETALQPFTRLDQLNTSESRGLGIGLALAKRYAEILGGNLSYQHAPTGGSTFVIMLPLSTT